MDDASPVDRREIERLARLARVTLDDEEIEALAFDLTAILAYVRKLATGPEEPAPSALEPESTSLRADCTETGLSVDESLSGAPQRLGNGFAVPRVLE